MKAFITGSYAYGTPTEDSDIDIIIRMDKTKLKNESFKTTFALLANHTDGLSSMPDSSQSWSFKFGKLDLIVCLTDLAYQVWKFGTHDLVQRAPVTREEAVKHLKALRKSHGI